MRRLSSAGIALAAVLPLAGCGGGGLGEVRARLPLDAAAQDAVCANAASRLAPGMTYGAGQVFGLVNAAVTASQTAALLAQQGDTRGAAYWSAQPSDAPVYTCTYTGPPPTTFVQPGPCPSGQDQAVDGLGPQRTFFVDAAGHATEDPVSVPGATQTCLPH